MTEKKIIAGIIIFIVLCIFVTPGVSGLLDNSSGQDNAVPIVNATEPVTAGPDTQPAVPAGTAPGISGSAQNDRKSPEEFALGDLTDKKNLSESQKKLSTTLLLQTPGSPPAALQFRDAARSSLQIKNAKTGAVSGRSAAMASAAVKSDALSEELVYVYVLVQPGYSTHIIDPYADEVTDRDDENRLAAAWVDTGNLEALAALDGVRKIQEVIPPVTYTGSVNTQGDVILKTAKVRATYKYTGSGIKVGVISDGVDHLADSKASGDLPADVTVLSNTNPLGGTINDEGTAMLEIIHDMVPGAKLYFHDCGTNTVAFNSAIDDLYAAGCTVIVDDIGWLTEPYFEDGTVASHVKTLVSGSRLVYVSAAGNLANSHYQGGFYNGGSGFHDFSRGTDATYKNLYVHMPAGYSVLVVMEWNDKFGLSANDYDLGIVDLAAPGVPLAVSVNTQDGTGDPLEYISYTNPGSDMDIAVIAHKYSGVAKTLELYIYTNNPSNIYSNNIVASDSIFGQAAVPGIIAVAAAPASSPATIEPFSGRGPVTISYPAAETRKKPDITGIDGVTITGAGGFSSPFYGTSAAAPHIAAIVAQIWAAHPSLTPPQVRTALYTSAIDLGAVGGDPKFGTGRADAMAMEAKLFKSKIGVFRNSTRQWFLDSNGNGIWDGTPTDKAYKFMLSTDTPITGDWDGNNKTEIGAFRNSTRQWLLDTNGDGMWEATDKVYTFMLSTDTPITGDWNGDYKTEIGVFRNRTRQWFLDYNGNGRWDGPPNDKVYTFMLSTDTPVTGDWNGNGKTKIGVFRNSTQRWYLDYNGNGIWDGPPTDKVYVFGMSTDMAITGDWDRNGKTEIGVFRNSIQKWLLDYNGNGIWDGAPKDKLYKFMLSTDTPVTGDWK